MEPEINTGGRRVTGLVDGIPTLERVLNIFGRALRLLPGSGVLACTNYGKN